MIFKESKYIEENKTLHLKQADGEHKSKDNVLQVGTVQKGSLEKECTGEFANDELSNRTISKAVIARNHLVGKMPTKPTLLKKYTIKLSLINYMDAG